MPRYELELRVDPPGGNEFGSAISEESQRLRERVYRELRLKVHSHAWARIDPGSSKGQDVVQKLIGMHEAGLAKAGTGHLREIPDDEESARSDWFYLFTRSGNDSFSLWDDYPSCKLSDLGPEHAYSDTFVSQQFVDACEGSGLSGISFLQCRKRGRKPGPAWFAALPQQCLGRGLDHHWFDRREWLRQVGDDPNKRSTSPETGQSNFHQSCLRADQAKKDALLQPLLELFPESDQNDSGLLGLNFITVPRYWAGVFPEGDFAHVMHGEDGRNREGKMMRFRKLVVSRRARQFLIDAGLFSEKVFLGLRSIASPEAGVENLDQIHGPIVPMYLPDELEKLRAMEKTLSGN